MSDQNKFIEEEEEDEDNDTFYTPPEHRRLFTWDDISGLSALDSSPDRSRPRSPTMLGPRQRVGSPVQHRYPVPSSPRYEGASTSGASQQQLEPSVRPKVRARRERADSEIPQDYPSSIGIRYGEPSTSSSSLQQKTEPSVRSKVRPISRLPIPKQPKTPTPEIVRRYRDPNTGEPDLQSMSRSAQPPPFVTSEAKAYELANRSRRQIKDINQWPRSRRERKMKLLNLRGFGHDNESKRYRDWSSGSSDESDVPEFSERRHLTPSRADESELFNPRFNRPSDMMGGRARSEVMPVGRIGFGRLDPNYRSKYNEIDELRIPDVADDPAQWNPKEQAFALRLRSLSEDDVNTYRDFRSQADPQFQQFARRRMSPAPTGTGLMDYNKSYVGRVRRQSQSSGTKLQRRASVGSRASLPSSLDDITVPLTSLDERRKVPTGGGASTFLRRRELLREQQPLSMDERTRLLLSGTGEGKKKKKKKKKCFIQ